MIKIDDIKIRCYNIEWDTDGEEEDLPTEVTLILTEPKELIEYCEARESCDEDDFIADKLSWEYGWCVNSFEYEEV